MASTNSEFTEYKGQLGGSLKARIHFRTWGRGPGSGLDAVAVAESYESHIAAVVRSLERRTGLVCCGGPKGEGTALHKGKPEAHHYCVTLGSPCRGGGYTPRAEIWIAIPIGGAK